jgi:hypothetical protein
LKNKFIWIGLGCLGVVLLGGCLVTALGLVFWRANQKNPPTIIQTPPPAITSDPSVAPVRPEQPVASVTPGKPVVPVAPVVQTEQLNKAILASPALAERKSDANPVDSLFRVVGTPQKPQARPWTNGGQVLRCTVDVEMRPTATAPWSRGQALVEITVDDRGNILTSRTLHIKGPDELELERLAR